MGAGQANSSSPVDVIEQMGSLKKAAENFGSILHCSKCPVIHIKGNNQIFSCYDLWGHNVRRIGYETWNLIFLYRADTGVLVILPQGHSVKL
eukprot:1316915-Amorphochlora_amoeboformis.AAC.3